jgi:DNA polymerase (family X)
MENREYARILGETGDLLEIAGEDGFRIRSYRNAASAIDGYPERVDDLLNNPDRKVTDIPGIGKGIALTPATKCWNCIRRRLWNC